MTGVQTCALPIFDTEFNNIQIASATKADSANAALTGTTTAVTLDVSGTLTAGTITGGSY